MAYVSVAPPFQGDILPNRLASAQVFGQRVLMADANGLLCHADPSGFYEFAGVSWGAAGPGLPVSTTLAGLMTDSVWAWQTGLPIWTGPHGCLVQTIPTAGVMHKIGYALSPTEIVVQPRHQILLA